MSQILQNKRIFSSIGRYIKYATNLSDKMSNVSFVLFDSSGNIEFSEKIEFKVKTIIFSFEEYSSDSIVYLLDFDHLGKNIGKALRSIERYTLLQLDEVRNRLDVFFKGHGTESLSSNLNDVIYNFRTGLTQLKESPEDFDRFRKFVFTPGFESWEKLIKRLQQYEDLLILSGFGNEIKKVQENVDLFNIFYNALKPLKIEKILSMSDKSITEKMKYLENIDTIFSQIEAKVKEFNIAI